MKKSSILLLAFMLLIGCGEKTPVQTVDWYKSHDIERKAMIEKCKANPGELGESANCVNAQQAENAKANARRGWLNPVAPGTDKKRG